MSKEKNIVRGFIYIIIAVSIPIITWVIAQQFQGENAIYFISYLLVLPLSIIISIPLFIIGILNLIPDINMSRINIPRLKLSKKAMTARKCKACGLEIPAGENVCPKCTVLN